MPLTSLKAIENQLLFQPEQIFSNLEYHALARKILPQTERGPLIVREFSNYLLGLIAYHTQDYSRATTYFHNCRHLASFPVQSQAFLTIYQVLIHFEHHPQTIHQQLLLQRCLLTRSQYAFLLIQLIRAAALHSTQKARSFYWNLQLFELLPTLPKNKFTAQLYYEIGFFSLLTLQNIVLAEAYFQESLAILPTKAAETRGLQQLNWIGLAYAATINDELEDAYDYYANFILKPFIGEIDAFYYYKALINALYVHSRLEKTAHLPYLKAQIAPIIHLVDHDKRESLLFSAHGLQIQWLLHKDVLSATLLAETQAAMRELLPRLHQNLVFGFPKITWARLQGDIAVQQKRYLQARIYFTEMLTLSIESKQLHFQRLAHTLLVTVAEALGEFDVAVHHFELADQLQIIIFQEQNRYFLASLQSQLNQKGFETEMIQKALDNRLLEQSVIRDPLTKLFNRHYLNNLQIRLPLAHPLFVAMIDLDYFKHYNDTHGHLAGDALLVTFADLLLRTFSGDEVIRYGGEEFLVLSLNQSNRSFEQKLADLHEQLKRAKIAHPTNITRYVTTSVGYTLARPSSLKNMTMAREVLATADTALYEAKANGRNQTQFLAHVLKTTTS